MIVGLIAIIYIILGVFDVINFKDEKLFILLSAIGFELLIFDSILYIIWSKW